VAPSEMIELLTTLKNKVKRQDSTKFSVHCHDDLGLATANSLAAILAGVDQVECTVNGLGERAGNAALEELVISLFVRSEVYSAETGVNPGELKNLSSLVSQASGFLVPPNKAVVGKNCFSHESGIHQHGVIKNPSTYELYPPQLLGIEDADTIVLGRHSGRKGLVHAICKLGYSLEDGKLEGVYEAFMLVAEKQKQISEHDLVEILASVGIAKPDEA